MQIHVQSKWRSGNFRGLEQTLNQLGINREAIGNQFGSNMEATEHQIGTGWEPTWTQPGHNRDQTAYNNF